MSIEMYLSETKQQATQAIRLANAYSQTVGDIATSCQAFFTAPLSSQTYDSAKTYFTTVYPPLVHGVMMVCEALALAQQAFPDTYESEVDTCDLNEEDLKQRIEQGRQLLATQQATLEALEESDPALEERMSSTQDTLKDLEEKLTNLYAFHASSPPLFADVESLLAQLQSGMTEVAKGQAWNSQTETFDLRRINLKWITPLNRAWQAHQAEKAGRKMDEALNKKLQNYTLIKCYDAKNNQMTWSIEDNGKRVNDPALQKYLSEIGAYLLESDYAILKLTPKEWATRINNHWKNGMEYFQGGDVPFVFRGFGHVQDYVEHRYEDGTWDALWALGMTAATIRHAIMWEKANADKGITPSSAKGGNPKGKYSPPNSRGLIRENETADLFASKGYKVEMLEEISGGNGYGIKPSSNPDYLIEDIVFDCYSPDKGTSIKGITKQIYDKTKKQTTNIVVNLDDYVGNIEDLKAYLLSNTNNDLKYLTELYFVKNNEIFHIFRR